MAGVEADGLGAGGAGGQERVAEGESFAAGAGGVVTVGLGFDVEGVGFEGDAVVFRLEGEGEDGLGGGEAKEIDGVAGGVGGGKEEVGAGELGRGDFLGFGGDLEDGFVVFVEG